MTVERIEWAPVRIEVVRGRGYAQTLGVSWYEDEECIIRVPTNLWHDGASVPNLCYPVIDATPLSLFVGGEFHDCLYRIEAAISTIKFKSDEVERRYHDDPRLFSDRILAKILYYMGQSDRDCWKVLEGVRLGGKSSWQQKPLFWDPRL